MVGNLGGGEVTSKSRDGTIQVSDTVPHGNDPFPPRDKKWSESWIDAGATGQTRQTAAHDCRALSRVPASARPSISGPNPSRFHNRILLPSDD